MDKFFNQYADLTALILTFLLPLAITVLVKRQTGKKARAVPSYLLFFGPSGILIFIFFHLFENSYRAISSAIAGSFIYNFHFYSLILMGVVVAGIGYLFFRACWIKCTTENTTNKRIFRAMILIVIVTIPLIPITSIAALPSICTVFSLAGLPFVTRKAKNITVNLNKELNTSIG